MVHKRYVRSSEKEGEGRNYPYHWGSTKQSEDSRVHVQTTVLEAHTQESTQTKENEQTTRLHRVMKPCLSRDWWSLREATLDTV